jgi:hypothetical protein
MMKEEKNYQALIENRIFFGGASSKKKQLNLG